MSGLRIVRVTHIVFEAFLLGPQRVCTSDLPRDIEVVGLIQTPLDQRSEQFEIICRSTEWEPSAEGAAIPSISPTFHTQTAPAFKPRMQAADRRRRAAHERVL